MAGVWELEPRIPAPNLTVEGLTSVLPGGGHEGGAQGGEFRLHLSPGASGAVAGALARRAGLFQTLGFFGEPHHPLEERGVGSFVLPDSGGGPVVEARIFPRAFPPPGPAAKPCGEPAERPEDQFPRGETQPERR